MDKNQMITLRSNLSAGTAIKDQLRQCIATCQAIGFFNSIACLFDQQCLNAWQSETTACEDKCKRNAEK